MGLIHLEHERLREQIDPAGLIEAIRSGFSGSFESSPRMHQSILGAHPSTLLIMPAWEQEFAKVPMRLTTWPELRVLLRTFVRGMSGT